MSEKKIIQALDAASLPCIRSQRKAILELEAKMLEQQQSAIPVEHLVHGGMYARSVKVPAGTLLTGNIYKYDHIEVMASGVLMVTTDDGQSRLLEGYNLMPALTGKKRAAYAIEDTVWITFHAVGEVDIESPDEIQDRLTVKTFEDLDEFYAKVNRIGYRMFLQDLGIDQDYMDAIVKNHADYIELSLEEYGLEMKDSIIHGKGIFATEMFGIGATLACSRVGAHRTQLGRYINHAVRPNCKFNADGDDIICVTISTVYPGDELTVNYSEILTWRSEVGDI